MPQGLCIGQAELISINQPHLVQCGGAWQRGVSLGSTFVVTLCALQTVGQVVISSHENHTTCREVFLFLTNMLPLMLTDLTKAMRGSAPSIWNKGARLTGSGLSALPDLLSCAYTPVASSVLHQDAYSVPLQERMWHLNSLLLNLPVTLKTIPPGHVSHLHKRHSSHSTTAS